LGATAFQRAPAGYLENIFGPDTNWWNPTARWKAAAPKARVWLGEAANDPIVPRDPHA
jgi:hypothetical protein